MSTAASSLPTPTVVTSFALNPLTTTFSRPPDCTGIYASGLLTMIDVSTTCLPAGFQSAPTSFFSPGLACPSGYASACHDSTGAASVTTVTCCPAYDADITLGCVVDTDTLRGAWATIFCTWLPPGNVTSLPVTRTRDGVTTTVTAGFTRSLGQGLNAFGVRMVYQTSDLVGATAAAGAPGDDDDDESTVLDAGADGGGAAAAAAGGRGGGGGGLSQEGTVVVAVVVPVLVLAVAALVLGAWRGAQRRRGRDSDATELPRDGRRQHHPKPELMGTPVCPPVEIAHSGRQHSELMGSAVPCTSPAVELPTSLHSG